MVFIQSAHRFENYHKEDASLTAFVERLLLLDSQDKEDKEEEGPKPDKVTMMTLHSSKGLEYDHIFFVGVEEEFLPHKRTLTEGDDVSEELRLSYVGVTRARKNLVMTFCKNRKLYGRECERKKSRFLLGLESLYSEVDRNNFGHLTKEESDQYKRNFFDGLIGKLK